ncbi:MAG: hypothetical protein WD402_07180 [Chloroflexota bacterium]
MQSAEESTFQAGAQGGPQLELELVSSDARIAGSVSLGAYSRLSDLLNFHDEILTVSDGAVLTPQATRSADAAPRLDVRLNELTLVIDRSNYVPPVDEEQMIEKREHRMLAVTDAYVITATFFIYAGAEAVPYLRANEPRWIPVTDVNVRSLVDREVEFDAKFAVLHRKPLLATAVI